MSYNNSPVMSSLHVPTSAELAINQNLLNGTGPDGGLLSEQAFYKTAAQTYAVSSTTLQNDTDLNTPNLAANGVYQVEALIFYSTLAAALLKIGFTFPSGAGLTWSAVALDSSVTAAAAGIVSRAVLGSGTLVLGCNATNFTAARISGLLIMSSTVGKLQFQAAQSVSNATAPKIGASSYMTIKRLA